MLSGSSAGSPEAVVQSVASFPQVQSIVNSTSVFFGDELYRIGASLLPPLFPAVTRRRIRFHSPFLILLLTGLFVTQGLVILNVPTYLHQKLIWFGDISVIIGAHVPFTALELTYDYITASILFLSWRQKREFERFGTLPPQEHFLLVNGVHPPEHFGLENRSQQLEAFIAFVRRSFPLCALTTNVVLPVEVATAFYAIFALKMLSMSPEEAPLLLWIITGAFSGSYALKTHLAFSFLLYHILHFYVICGYLSLKFDRLFSSISALHFPSLKLPNSSSEEPKVFLLGRLSELLVLIRSSLTVNVAIFLYIVCYIEAINRFNRVVSALVGGLEFVALSAFFMKAGEVNQRAVKVYKKMNGVVARGLKFGVMMKLKVFVHSMENWSSTKIGFTCGRLFSVNYFTYYEDFFDELPPPGPFFDVDFSAAFFDDAAADAPEVDVSPPPPLLEAPFETDAPPPFLLAPLLLAEILPPPPPPLLVEVEVAVDFELALEEEAPAPESEVPLEELPAAAFELIAELPFTEEASFLVLPEIAVLLPDTEAPFLLLPELPEVPEDVPSAPSSASPPLFDTVPPESEVDFEVDFEEEAPAAAAAAAAAVDVDLLDAPAIDLPEAEALELADELPSVFDELAAFEDVPALEELVELVPSFLLLLPETAVLFPVFFPETLPLLLVNEVPFPETEVPFTEEASFLLLLLPESAVLFPEIPPPLLLSEVPPFETEEVESPSEPSPSSSSPPPPLLVDFEEPADADVEVVVFEEADAEVEVDFELPLEEAPPAPEREVPAALELAAVFELIELPFTEEASFLLLLLPDTDVLFPETELPFLLLLEPEVVPSAEASSSPPSPFEEVPPESEVDFDVDFEEAPAAEVDLLDPDFPEREVPAFEVELVELVPSFLLLLLPDTVVLFPETELPFLLLLPLEPEVPSPLSSPPPSSPPAEVLPPDSEVDFDDEAPPALLEVPALLEAEEAAVDFELEDLVEAPATFPETELPFTEEASFLVLPESAVLFPETPETPPPPLLLNETQLKLLH
ncbi:hypothetical protein TYRP_022651 [Tyrophagus putrescentiae]|nr:hypothetical protein TYRP_022651 [Tyrophagus putrescentiae]